ncbi:hypothetical protein [Billgrantia gudaonensis]|uniref:Uncharacterized protein n=1 Tax=Billgrantia gudaonensis TaxID=376427 RepID=A0A1G8PGK9_9GAMM|nr:hypothetical protein [Halomonas gudaonensis]SDI91476.1 hypothetical protein SAMN04487954_10274 [Halomonas gudaonensis]
MKTFAKAPLALAITALLAAPYALAGDNDFDTDAKMDVDVENDIEVEIGHEIENDIWVELDLKADVVDPNHFSIATIDRKQFTNENSVYDDETDNDSTATGSGNRASGNMGVNVASGGLNSQANDAAISKGSDNGSTTTTTTTTEYDYYPTSYHGGVWKPTEETTVETDEAMVFAKAATFSIQSSSNGIYNNDATNNNAGTTDSFNRASGNLGVNMAAGFGNAQHNGMALSVGNNSSAEATVAGVQAVYNNELDNEVSCGCGNTNNSYLTNSFNRASGNVGVNIASGNANMQSNTLSIARAK